MWDVIPSFDSSKYLRWCERCAENTSSCLGHQPCYTSRKLNHIRRWKICLLVLMDDNKSLRSSLIDSHKRLTLAKRFREENQGSHIQHSSLFVYISHIVNTFPFKYLKHLNPKFGVLWYKEAILFNSWCSWGLWVWMLPLNISLGLFAPASSIFASCM